MTTSDRWDPLRRAVDRELLSGTHWCAHNLFNALAPLLASPEDHHALLEYWWDLARTGVVALPGDDVQHTVNPRLVLTATGRRLLERQGDSPHDESRYLRHLRSRVPEPDPIALDYLREAVGAWRAGLHRSSAIMVGCACERLILDLASSASEAPITGCSEKLKKALAPPPTSIATTFRYLQEALVALKEDKKLPRELSDDIEGRLPALFHYTRILRNDSGHPTGATIRADDAEAALLLFPSLHELASRVAVALKALS